MADNDPVNEMGRELEKSIDRAVEETNRERPLLKAVQPKAMGLSDQWAKLQTIDQELRKRIRQERLMISAQFDRLLLETHADFDQRVETAMTALEADRRRAVQRLIDDTAEKLREHDLLAQKMK